MKKPVAIFCGIIAAVAVCYAVVYAQGIATQSINGNMPNSNGAVTMTMPSTVLTGTTGSIGGGLLSAATCTSGTATVIGATVGMATVATPNTYPGDGAQYQSYVSAPNVVTVKVCALLLLTPVATTYNVRVDQ